MSDLPTVVRYASRNMANTNEGPAEIKTDDIDEAKHEEPAMKQLDASHTMSRSQAIMLAGTVMLTYWMMAMSVSSSLIIVPAMSEWFKVSDLAVQWVASSYTLAYGCGLLVAGRLADLYGRKQLFIGGLCLGLIANIISGVVPNRIGLCIVRAFAGRSLALASPAGFGIIGVNYRTEPARTMAFAAIGVGSPAGASVGQILGGVVSSTGGKGWQYIYFIISGFNLVPIITGLIYIPREPARTHTENRRVDWVGAGLVTVGLSLLTFFITQAGLETDGWGQAYIPVVLAISVILLIAFGFWEYHAEHKTAIPPIVKLGMFTRHHWRISAVLLIAFLDWCGICGWVYLTSIYYQKLLDLTPLQNAIRILPGPITGILCSYLVTILAPRVSAPILLIAGGISTGLANCLFAVRPLGTLYWKLEFFSAILHPFGGDLTIPIGSVLISNLCADDEQSVAGALFQVSLQLAATLDICLSSYIHVQRESSVGLLTALRESFWFNASLCWAVVPLVLVSLRKVGLAKDIISV